MQDINPKTLRITNPYSLSITNPFSLLSVAAVALFYGSFSILFRLRAEGLGLGIDFFVTSIILVVSQFCAFSFRSLAHIYGRHAANRTIERLSRHLFDGTLKEGSFLLYLRPHWLDGKDDLINPYFTANRAHPNYWFHLQSISFDHWLTLELTTVVVALGTREMRLSTGSVRVPDEIWKATVTELMKKAKAIIMIPGVTEGLMWELEEINRICATSRVVILQPPEMSPRRIGVAEAISGGPNEHDQAAVLLHWTKIRPSLLDSYQLELPPYDAHGHATTLVTKADPYTKSLADMLNSRFSAVQPKVQKWARLKLILFAELLLIVAIVVMLWLMK